ncbi:hypothetical protein KFL_009230020 [Klebsormidium nitens]|uniref:Uncharacterized protein n=1 Tax=Klebsormidium nitens TaxID=105231 RepID=A0A1Y1ITV4_KLENI|nr:hypothetical protein KFL_009230020 [Klebsormidium nitens]|eukprot:GAQ92107.1 hypothetical protein KFL_009230020 [Klebsormidium nitens]
MAGMQRAMTTLLLLCLVGAALLGSAHAVPKLLESQHVGEADALGSLEPSPDNDYWERLSAEDVENVLADDDSFDAQLFTSILDAIQHNKLRSQAALEEAARHALEGGLVRHGRKINGQVIRSVLPSTDAEAALLAHSNGGAQQSDLDAGESASSGESVQVQMRLVVGHLHLEMPWVHCMWHHVKQLLGGLWTTHGAEPVAGPRRHSLTKRHAAVASPSAPHEVQEQLDLLTRSGFADEGDAVLDLLHQFDSGDGESEELPLQHGPELNMQHLNRKVKISVMRIPSREGLAPRWAPRWWTAVSGRCGVLLSVTLVLVFVVSGAILILSALQAEEKEQCKSCRHRAAESADCSGESDEGSDSEVEIKRVVTYTLHQ